MSAMTTTARKAGLTAAESFWYVLGCIAFGVAYLQKVPVLPEPADESEKVTRVVNGLKDVALAMEVPVISIVAADREGLLAHADESLDRRSHLVENLLDMSGLQAGALSLFPRPSGLDEIVARALDTLDPLGGDITVAVFADQA